MTDAPPLRAKPEDRPLPPSGAKLPASPAGGNLPASPAGGSSPAAPAAAPATAPQATPHTRPIGRVTQPPRDWRRAWPGFLAGLALIAIAIGLSWLLWEQVDAPRAAQVPPEQLPAVELAEIEALLDALGFPPGRIDGAIDEAAAAAIRDFQATAGLAADGIPSSVLLEELRAAHAELFGGR